MAVDIYVCSTILSPDIGKYLRGIFLAPCYFIDEKYSNHDTPYHLPELCHVG